MKTRKMNDNQHIPSGYKPSPLGPIPEDWEVKSVKDISTIKGRIGYRGYTINDIVNDGDGAISLSPSNIVDGKLQFNSVTSITWEKYYESPEIMLRDGDIVMVKTGSSFGKVAFVENLPHETTINPQFVIINNIKCDNKWLCYLFESDCIQKNVHRIVVGGAIPTMSQEEIASFRIAVPPLPEQQRIVSVLSLWDTAIEKQTALIEKLTLRKRGLMQQLLTGKKRLKGFSGEWKELRLGEVALVIGGGTPNTDIPDYWSGDIPWFTPSEIGEHKYVNTSERTISEKGLNDSSAKLLPQGTILFTSRATIGAKAILTTEATTNQGFQSFVANNENNNEFIYYYLDIILNEIKQKASGSTFPEVSAESLRRILIKIPNTNEQNAIASVLVNADKEIEIQKQKLAAMQAQKKGLMQVLLTGKKRIK